MSFLYIGKAQVDEILKTRTYLLYIVNITDADVLTTQWAWASPAMGILPEKQYCGLRMRRECREPFCRRRGLAIPTCITGMHAGIAN